MVIKSQPFIVNCGPQHPSTHGVFRMRLVMDGETIIDLEPVIGYLHRSCEKIAEEKTYTQFIPVTDRMDYLASMTNNLAYCVAVEKLAGVEVPERAQYIRVIMSELQRIASHMMALGTYVNDCGAWQTPLMYNLVEREKVLDLFEMTCGARLTYNYMRFGGVSHDLPKEFMPSLNRFLAAMPAVMDDYERLVLENEILLVRSKGVGVLTKEQAINSSAAGPMLRASGVPWDIRKADPYCVYDRFNFDIPVGSAGDCWDRFLVRLGEVRQSLRILQQAVEQIPHGDIRAKLPFLIRPPVGDAYGRIEGPRGEIGFYVVSDSSTNPYRVKIRPPSLINLTTLREMVVGSKIADAIVVLGSIDIVLGEVDR